MSAVLGANVSAGVSAGTHVCAFFATDDERAELLRAYFSERRGERLVYVGQPEHVRGTDGIELRDAAALYLAGGSFDPDGVLEAFAGEIAQTLADGHGRLRVAADMSWAQGADPDVLVSYEAEANRLHRDGTAWGMCLYDRRRFSDGHMAALAAVHPFTADTAGRQEPAAFTASTDADGTLRLTGEIDYFGAAHLVTLLSDQPRRGDDIVIDLSGVRFMDASALRALQEAVLGPPGPRRLVLRSPSRVVSRLLALLPASDSGSFVVTEGA